MKLENNWRHKALTNLEKDEWPSFQSDSRLIRRTKELRNVPLDAFTTEDLRIMIGQQVGLNYLIPLALETLSLDLFAEGNFYEGDLLNNVLAIPTAFWDENKEYWNKLNDLIRDRREDIAIKKIDTSNFDRSRYNL
jgi:hypothetical protein